MTGLGLFGFVTHSIMARAAGGLGLLSALAFWGRQEAEPSAAAYQTQRREMVEWQLRRLWRVQKRHPDAQRPADWPNCICKSVALRDGSQARFLPNPLACRLRTF